MQTMLAILAVVAPVFGIIALGFAAARLGWVPESVSRLISRFVFGIAIPAFLFRTMVTAAAPEASPWALWASYFGPAALAGLVCALAIARGLGRSAPVSVISGLGAAYSNTVLLGIPLILSFLPRDEAAVPLFIIISINLPVMTLAGTLLVEWTRAGDGPEPGKVAAQALRSIVTNPIVLGLGAGLAWRLTGTGLPAPVEIVTGWLATIAVPAALFAMGLALNRFGIAGDPATTAVILALKLVVHPALAWAIAVQVFGLPPVWVAVAVLFAAAPTGINVFLFASRYDIAVPAVSSAIALGTALSAITITIFAWALGLHAM